MTFLQTCRQPPSSSCSLVSRESNSEAGPKAQPTVSQPPRAWEPRCSPWQVARVRIHRSWCSPSSASSSSVRSYGHASEACSSFGVHQRDHEEIHPLDSLRKQRTLHREGVGPRLQALQFGQQAFPSASLESQAEDCTSTRFYSKLHRPCCSSSSGMAADRSEQWSSRCH